MSDLGREILTLVVVAIISFISQRVFKKYRIIERKLGVLVFFLFLFGLLFTTLPIVYVLIIASNGGTLSLLNIFLFALSFLVGAFLLGIMVWRVVQKDEIQPVSVSDSQGLQTANFFKRERRPVSPWIFISGGLLLAAICVLLYWGYGPQHDPPGMTAEHRQIDMVISYICASAAILGLVIFGAGVRKLACRRKIPKDFNG